MRPAIQKALGWMGLAIGGGGILLFVWGLVIYGWPSNGADWVINQVIWYWLAGTATLTIASLWLLRRAYRQEPVPGGIQFALVDLICSLLILASVLYIGSYAEGEATLLQYWFLPALVISCSYLAGVTRAASMGLRGWRRYAVGTSTMLTIIGCLGIGALVVLTSCLAGMMDVDYCRAFVLELLGIENKKGDWLNYSLRISLCALPLGLLLGLVLRLTMRSGSGSPATGKSSS